MELDDWSSVSTEKYFITHRTGPVIRLDFTSTTDLAELHLENGLNVWFDLTNCRLGTSLSRWGYIYYLGYPIGGVYSSGDKVPMSENLISTDKSTVDKKYYIFFDYMLVHELGYNLAKDSFDVCLIVGAGDMTGLGSYESAPMVIKNSFFKQTIGAK